MAGRLALFPKSQIREISQIRAKTTASGSLWKFYCCQFSLSLRCSISALWAHKNTLMLSQASSAPRPSAKMAAKPFFLRGRTSTRWRIKFSSEAENKTKRKVQIDPESERMRMKGKTSEYKLMWGKRLYGNAESCGKPMDAPVRNASLASRTGLLQEFHLHSAKLHWLHHSRVVFVFDFFVFCLELM